MINKKLKSKTKKFLLHVVLPLYLGGMLYIVYRTESLLMFSWFDFLGLKEPIAQLRNFKNEQLPHWLLFSLADAIWVYSFTLMMLIIWDFEINKKNFYWILLGAILGIGGEIAQLFGLTGTFDLWDLILSLVACVLAFIQTKNFQKLFNNKTDKD
ncbi:MAG: hypothetical protein GF335_04740 [Candidatus Moranbacteria bacterium]|nr:hypothetical protein [Candidatus Moranbacteria bacterium]